MGKLIESLYFTFWVILSSKCNAAIFTNKNMNPDDPVCLCFHVSRRKVVNFIRVEKPKRPSQLSQCFGAGTGCGWCRPYLERLLNDSLANDSLTTSSPAESTPVQAENPDSTIAPTLDMTIEQYKSARSAYVREGGGTPPPGAAPIEPDESKGPAPEND